jgi:acyl-CoA reductase-like NAD-dependent aldehyde dehydrogenase
MPNAASSAHEVRAAAARLREAGGALRARPRAERVAVLGKLLERLRDPNSAIRVRLAAELPEATGFHPTTLSAGLDAGFAAWTARALADLVAGELESKPRRLAAGFPLTALVLGGAIPMPSVLQILAPLALGSPVLARPGAHDPVTARAVARELARLDAHLGSCLEVVSFPHTDAEALAVLAEADCVVATGSDAAVAAVAARVRPWQRFVGYGHRFSAAVLARGADLAAACAELARDTALWDQAGCLSPLALYAIGWAWEERSELLDQLASSFAEIEQRWPLGRAPTAEAAARASEIATAELRAAASDAVDVRRDRANKWALLAERDLSFRGSPGSRVLRVHFAMSMDAVCAALAPTERHLASIGIAGLPEATAVAALAGLRPSRICPLGAMQAPPLSWCHDGQGVLLPLAALTDLEPAHGTR